MTLNRILFFFFLLGIGFSSCNSDDDKLDCLPFSTIDVLVNLNLPQFFDLNNPGGWAFVSGAGAGTRGLIVVNTGTRFRAYDRNSPQVCPGENTILTVEDGITIVSPIDGAQWILTSGQPLNDATLGRNLRTYNVSVNGSTLLIRN